MLQSIFHSTARSDAQFFQNGFDPRGPILCTNGGEVVDILTTNGPGPAPVIGLIFPGRVFNHQIRNGAGKLHRWNYDGKSYDSSGSVPRSLDLARNIGRNFDWSKRYKTGGGLNVTILTTNRIGERSIVALVGGKQVVLYYPDGRTRNDSRETELDLVNI